MKIERIIVVEGRDDTRAVKSAVECETIETHGYGISEETWKKLTVAYERKGLIILTDPDHAGLEIRRRVKKRFPESIEAFLPRRKAIKAGDIGVENAGPDDIREALEKALRRSESSAGNAGRSPGGKDQEGSGEPLTTENPLAAEEPLTTEHPLASDDLCRAEDPLTMEDMAANGLTGAAGSSKRRSLLAEKLGIGYGNAKAILARMNGYGITRKEFRDALKQIAETEENEI